MKHAFLAILACVPLALMSCASAPAAPAAIGAGDSASPNWTFAPDFKALGIMAATLPSPSVGESADIVLASANELSIAFNFSSPTYKQELSGFVRTSQNGMSYSVSVSFPESGDYVLELFAKRKAEADSSYRRISTAKFTATVVPIAVPEGWKAGPSFRKYGVVVTSATMREDQGVARISLSFNTPLSISYSLRNSSTGTSIDKMPEDTLRVSAKGASGDIIICFPEDGDYELGLYGKAEGTTDSTSIARVKYSIRLPVAIGKIPDNWTIAPGFRIAGLSFIADPPREVGNSMTLSLSVPEGFSAGALLRPVGAKEWLGSITQEVIGTELRVVAAFPASGAYELQVSGEAKAGAGRFLLVKAQLTAAVDPKLPRFFLWADGASWPRLPVVSLKESTEVYNPFDDSFPPSAHFKGLMAEDFAIPGLGAAFVAKKGTVVEFTAPDGADVKAITFVLSKDALVKLGDSPLTLKAGTSVSAAISSYSKNFSLTSLVSKDTKLAIAGGELLCPAQSRFFLWGGIIDRVELKGKGTFTYAKKSYECTGSAFVVEIGDKEPIRALRIATTKASQMKIGRNAYAAPAGSILTFSPAAVESILFSTDSSIMVDGKTEPIGTGWTVDLAADGSVKAKYQAED